MTRFTRKNNLDLKKVIASAMAKFSGDNPDISKELLKDVLLWMLSIINQKTDYRSKDE